MDRAIKQQLNESLILHKKIMTNKTFTEAIAQAAQAIAEVLLSGNKMLIAGNGGSAADSQHFAAELVGRYKKERRGYAAIALTTDTSILTAWGNDYSFDSLFARQIEAIGVKGDIFVGISTSGNSKNIIEAVSEAKKNGLRTICFLGKDGGKLRDSADITLLVPSANTARIQEVHTLLVHIISEEVETSMVAHADI